MPQLQPNIQPLHIVKHLQPRATLQQACKAQHASADTRPCAHSSDELASRQASMQAHNNRQQAQRADQQAQHQATTTDAQATRPQPQVARRYTSVQASCTAVTRGCGPIWRRSRRDDEERRRRAHPAAQLGTSAWHKCINTIAQARTLVRQHTLYTP